MKNICFFNSTPFWGGGEKFYFDYALGFKQKGYSVYVVSDEKSILAQKAKNQNIAQFHMSVNMLSFLNPHKLVLLVQFFQSEKIDTVLFSTSQDLKLGGLAAKWAGVENIVYRRGIAVPIKDRWLNRYLLQSVVTHIFANSEETKRTILQDLSDYITPDKIKVIYNGIKIGNTDPGKIELIERVQQKRKGIILGNAGRLTAQKGQQHLLEVAKILKDKGQEFTLFIAGSGELEASLRQKIAAYKLEEEVVLLGFVEDIPRFMNSIDIFLLSSVWEGFGYVLVEAMANSKPIVAFNITSNPEILSNDITGFLVPYPDVATFAQKTKLLIENDELRKEMGEAGKIRALNKFEFDKSLAELEAYLIEKD